jgi:creatinine amidohydrolase
LEYIKDTGEDIIGISLSELTLKDVKEYLKRNNIIIIPIGSTEEHGEHLPFTVDADISTEVARRVAQKIDALVAPTVYYGLSRAHSDFPGTAWLTGETLMRVIEDISISFAKSGFKRIIWINGHYCNEPALYVACGDITGTNKVPEDTKVYGFSYWLALPDDVAKQYLSWDAGWHAQAGETSIMLAIKPDVVKMEYAQEEWPVLAKRSTVVLNCISAGTGCWKYMTKSGVWGDAKKATKEKGEAFLNEIVNAVIKTIMEIEAAFHDMEKK